MQVYEGYFENGQFRSTSGIIHIPERCRVLVTILDEPPIRDKEMADQMAAMDKFIEAVEDSDVEVPKFERMNINFVKDDE